MLEYVALGILIFAAVTLFYGIIVIHDIPYEIAKHRNHPQQDALHVAGWVSLFTLHVLWPFLWIWATLYREDRGWGFSNDNYNKQDGAQPDKQAANISKEQLLAELLTRIEVLESALAIKNTTSETLGNEAVSDEATAESESTAHKETK